MNMEGKICIETLTVGMLGTQCYVVSPEGGDACLVIDPGAEADRILRAAGEKRIEAVLLTHGHFDHIGAVDALAAGGARVLIHPLDAPMLARPELNASLPLLGRRIMAETAAKAVHEGETLNLAGMEIQVMHTPGHTPGGVCYRIGDDLFTGDTLFEHGWGRTDLPGGDEGAMMNSLRRLIPMMNELRIHPGHA